jgi:hypothetical protein
MPYCALGRGMYSPTLVSTRSKTKLNFGSREPQFSSGAKFRFPGAKFYVPGAKLSSQIDLPIF